MSEFKKPRNDDYEEENIDEQILKDEDDIIDGNDIENNEDKIYEESLDLDMTNLEKKVWLVRLPLFLAQKWRDDSHLKGQDLGKIRINKKTQKIQMILNEDVEGLEDMPHSYEIDLTQKYVQNEYIFTEQNLKKYEQRAQQLEQNPELQKQLYILKKEKQEEFEKRKKKLQQQYKKNRKKQFKQRIFIEKDGRDRYIPYVKTIPKKTAIVGTVAHECQVVPSIKDPNYNKIIEQRKQMIKFQHKRSITVLDEGVGKTLGRAAGLSLLGDNSNFLKISKDNKLKEKKEPTRNIRMPKKELLNLLFKLFDEYNYWSLKGLKERTKQPEVYLKECLDHVALLIKKGPYALKYTLRSEYKKLQQNERIQKLGAITNEAPSSSGSATQQGSLGTTTILASNNNADEQLVNNNQIKTAEEIERENMLRKQKIQQMQERGNYKSNNPDDYFDEDVEMEDVE
ncbi:unnamed protein product [Hanseniaspora opuntiae]